MVSIIPGIEVAAPERTETSKGSSGSPKRLPVCSSSRAMCFATSSSSPSTLPSEAMKARHASVVIVKPAGTGIPSCVISASPIPLPPRSSRPPSEGSSKAYTYRVMSADVVIPPTMDRRTIVGIGGFPDEPMFEYVLAQARGRRVLVDRTASPHHGDPLGLPGNLTEITFYPWPPDDLREQALASDVILVCGGNTANMLAVWRVHGFDRILREAWEAGIVLAGWSAGMICWF